MKRIVSIVLIVGLFLCVESIFADDLIEGVTVNKKGMISVKNGDKQEVYMYLIHFLKNWKGSDQREDGRVTYTEEKYPQAKGNTWYIEGEYNLKNKKVFKFSEKLKKTKKNSFDYSLELKNKKGIDTLKLALRISLPTDFFAGKKIILNSADKGSELPDKFSELLVLSEEKINSIKIPLEKGNLLIEGKELSIYIEDGRKWDVKFFVLEIALLPSKGLISRSSLNLKISMVK